MSKSSLHEFFEEENNDIKMKKKSYIGLIIILLIFILLLIIMSVLSINPNYIKHFYHEYVLYVFIFIGLLIFIFGTIQIDYYFKKREYTEGNKNDRNILTHTLVGYIFLLLAYIPITLLVYTDEYKYVCIGLFGLFSLISMALLSSGIDKAKDVDKNINRILAIFVPIFVAMNGIIGIIAPLMKDDLLNNTLIKSSIKSKLSKGDAFRSATNPLQQYLEK